MNKENSNINKRMPKKKRFLLIAIGIALVLAAVSYILIEQPAWLIPQKLKDAMAVYSDKEADCEFYPADYELDVTTVDGYMELDRYVYYTLGGESTAINDGNYAQYGKAVGFFGEYFESIIAGDSESYNSFFTDEYYKSYRPYVSFAPQMLYDIEIEQLSAVSQDGGTDYIFSVSYRIYQNNGTYRRDIGSDAKRVLYYELADDGETVKIDRISSYITY